MLRILFVENENKANYAMLFIVESNAGASSLIQSVYGRLKTD